MQVTVLAGDLLDQDVDVIVNAWNRNPFPWWLLLPQGVSGAIRRRAGLDPFRELRRIGLLSLGEAVVTSAGHLPFKAIIHVAGIGLLWTASEQSIRASTTNALNLAKESGFCSIAFPLIGAGTGGVPPARAETVMLESIAQTEFAGEVRIVRYKRD